MKRRGFVLGAAALAAGVAGGWGFGCGPVEIEDQRRRLLSSWGKNALLGWYGETEALARSLGDRLSELCASPNATRLAAAQSAWWQLRAPWKRAEVFAFGPYSDEPLRLGPKIDFWPARPDSILEVLAGTSPLTAESVALLGAAARGMPAIEYLLYEPGTDVVAAIALDPRRCQYLLALAEDVIVQTGKLAAAWDPLAGNYLAELTQPGRGSRTFMTLQMALGEVVNRMGYTVENIRADKLGRPLGTTSGGVPQPDKAESVFSDRSLEDIGNNIEGIERLFFGAAGEPSLDAYLKSRGRHLALPMRQATEAVYTAIDAVPGPLREAIINAKDSVQMLIDVLGELQRTIQVDVLNALSLTVGFNDNDGD